MEKVLEKIKKMSKSRFAACVLVLLLVCLGVVLAGDVTVQEGDVSTEDITSTGVVNITGPTPASALLLLQ